jgi:hypothetical protein
MSRSATRTPGDDLAGRFEDARTGAFDALGHRFAVRSDDPSVVLLLEQAFAALAASGDPTGWYDLRHRGDAYELSWSGRTVVAGVDRVGALGALQWDIDRRAVAAAGAELVLHAGCVAHDGVAVLVGGPPRCGKSTLVAALVAHGFEYLTDVAVPVDLGGHGVRAFPRPMTLDDDALDLLPEIAALRASIAHDPERRLVAPPLAPSTEHERFQVALVVFPEHDPSGLTLWEPMNRGDAVVRLAEDAFNFPSHGRDAIDALTMLLQEAPAYQIVGNDPRAAVHAVVEALANRDVDVSQRHRFATASSRCGHRMCPGTGKTPV